MPSFTLIDEPTGLDLDEWLAYAADVRQRIKSKTEDEGLQFALQLAEETIDQIRRLNSQLAAAK